MSARGFTLIEMVVSLLLIGVLSAVTAVFMHVPFDSYLTDHLRLELADAAEPALRHMDAEIRTALPNSVRVMTSGGVTYIEFLAVRTSGRYRSAARAPATGCAGGDQLQFGALDNCFNSLGQAAMAPVVGDYVVIDNQAASCPNPLSAYCNGAADGPNKSRITAYNATVGVAPVESRIRMNNFNFTTASPTQRYYVISGPVTYACDPVAGTIKRYSAYPIVATQAVPPVPARAIVNRVSACSASYNPSSGVLDKGMLSVAVTLSGSVAGRSDVEALSLMTQIPVSKLP